MRKNESIRFFKWLRAYCPQSTVGEAMTLLQHFRAGRESGLY